MVEWIMLRLPYSDGSLDEIVKKSLNILKEGGIIAYPTESFYALGVPATDENSVRKLFDLKQRPEDKALPLIVGDNYTLITCVKKIPSQAEVLMARFWPGALTLIFEAKEHIPALLTGGTGKVAVRIPGESVAFQFISKLRLPVTATSANPSSLPPADSPEAVVAYFGKRIDLLIDAGKTPGGKPSTIVDVTVSPPKVLRQGSIVIGTQ
jgi:L-threonylcarbamoyladenylate synthase